MKEIDKINSALRATKKNPVKDEKIEMLADGIDRIKKQKAFWNSPVAEDTLAMIRMNCATALARAINNATTEPKLEVLLSAILQYTENIRIISSVLDITQEEEIQNQLDLALKEVYNIRE